LNSILGGQFSSRINLNLRENKGFTYGASSYYKYNQVSSEFCVSTAVNSENTGDAINEIIKELNGIQNEIKPKEVDFAKSYLIKRYPLLFETFSQVAKNLSTLIIYSLPYDYFNSYLQNIKSVDLNKVLLAAKEDIYTDSLTVLAVGDRKIIKFQLTEIAKDNVIELNLKGEPV
jgi:zinc protease